MSPTPSLPGALELGWLGLTDLTGCVLLEEPRWLPDKGSWAFAVELTSENSSHLVPALTRWFVVVDADYPAGNVEVFPARDGGLTATFPHQTYNGPPARGALWRDGNICVTVPWSESRYRDRASPPSTPETRLRWTLERAREWLSRAATRELVAAGDPYELPDFDPKRTDELGIIVAPGVTDTAAWLQRSTAAWGMAICQTMHPDRGTSRITLIRELRPDDSTSTALHPPWGSLLSGTSGTVHHGAWLWLPSPPCLRPWQAPQTWGELRDWAGRTGIDLERPLTDIAAHFRAPSGALLLVGFPIPTRFAFPFEQVAWQALRLPPLLPRARLPLRLRKQPLAALDRTGPLGDTEPLQWLATQTWSPDRLAVRGVADPALQSLRVAVIGVGAIGARLTELLVRAGVRQIHLIDGDTVAAGNLVRHPATLHALGIGKAVAMRDTLQAASPFAQITASTAALSASPAAAAVQLGDSELVIDATASDEVLRTLSGLRDDRPRLWASISLNRHAERLYCHLSRAPQFPLDAFEHAFRPWRDDDVHRHDDPLPWEGPGCWSPVFPARVDDITALVSLTVRELERLALQPPATPELRVYERRCDADGTLVELRRRESPDQAASGLTW